MTGGSAFRGIMSNCEEEMKRATQKVCVNER